MDKYLPIGSVCTLKGRNKQVMIVGYYSVEFNGNLKIKDYKGCAYPEGLLLPATITFNHGDIEQVDFVGYKNNQFNKFIKLFNKLTGNISEEEKLAKSHKKNDYILTSSTSYSKLLFDENGVVKIAEPVIEDNRKRDLEDIKFDEKGTVIGIGNNYNISNPFHQEYLNTAVSKEKQSNEWGIFKNIEFDENGFVTKAEEGNKSSKLNEIKFDENGIVISDGAKELEQEKNHGKYRFDENGILIATNEVESKTNSQIKSDNKTKTEYKFDENGVVIS